MTTFSQTLWSEIAPIRKAIDDLPFVRQLADGSLARERFDYYMGQDALYLADYARALAACAAQSTTSDDLVFWAGAARDCIIVERQLHDSHVDHTRLERSATCTAYVSYLNALAAGGSYPVLAAGLLPCFWIYEDVGNDLLAAAGDLEKHPYGDWIATYADEQFAEDTRAARAIVDRLAEENSESVRARMLEAFRHASRFEWMFWDAPDRMETWPIG
ncbi:TenA family protein [Mobilicoccus massiliensis]|uniref:TenA family protein n=1 Tax=Mobilicoccus massiliensis TaxID=1522310 RepID=UPI000694705A|nr:TenA family protein [Mobilicoccus massiliensis]